MHSVGLSLGLSQSFPRHRKHASTGFLLGNNRPKVALPGRLANGRNASIVAFQNLQSYLTKMRGHLMMILTLTLAACGWVGEYQSPMGLATSSDNSKITFLKWTPEYFEVTLIARNDGTSEHVEYEWDDGQASGHFKLPSGYYSIRYSGIPWYSRELFNGALSAHFIEGHTYRIRSAVDRPLFSNKPYKVSIWIEDVAQGVKVTDTVTHCYVSISSGKQPAPCP